MQHHALLTDLAFKQHAHDPQRRRTANGFGYHFPRAISSMKPLPVSFLALLLTASYLPALSAQPKPAEPKSATDWFRRADDRTNLRASPALPHST